MANFAESQNVQLAPYNPGVDLGVMNTALRYKQTQYDTNVQKIQSTIDNVAGLDVYRPIDKQYLEEKVNSLTSNLNQIGGSDFSNGSIVSQAVGLAGPIYKDENIRNAVASTISVKKLLADQRNLKDKHPDQYSPDNEWYDNQGIQRYLQSPKVGENYHGNTEATRYFDWQKPIKEAVEKLGPGVNYKIGSDGKFQYFIEKTSKVRPADIENVVNGLMSRDPRIQKQMQISGQYTYRDYDAPSLKNHINRFYDAQIPQVEELIKYYEDKKNVDPTNPLSNDEIKSFVADSKNMLEQMKASRDEYNSFFDSGVDLSKIKQTFFNDEVRKSYVINYQKNDRELEIKTNQSAVQAHDNWFKEQNLILARAGHRIDEVKLRLQMIAQGTDPDNGEAISVDNPKHLQEFYNANMRTVNPDGTWTVGGSGSSGGSGSGVFGQQGMQSSVSGPEANKYTQGLNEQRIKDIDASLEASEESMRKDYAQINPKLKYGTPEFAVAYEDWKNKQEQHIANQDGLVFPAYLRYKNNLQDMQTLRGSFDKLEKDITQSAISTYPIKNLNKPVRIEGLKIKNPDGTTQSVLNFNISQHEGFTMKFNKFHQEIIDNVKKRYGEGYFDDVTDGQNDPNIKKIALQLAETYKNDPDYRLFKAFADGGWSKITEGRDKIVAPVQDLRRKRQAQIDKDFEARGGKLTYRTTIFQGKEDQMNAVKALILSATSTDNLGDDVTTDPKNIHPIEGYMDDQGKAHIRYTDISDGKKAPIRDVIVPGDRTIFGNPDPYYKIEQAIEASPNRMTPIEGPGVRISPNGKVRYAISKSNIANGGYALSLIDENGNIVPVDSGYDAQGNPRNGFKNIKDIIDQVSHFSVMGPDGKPAPKDKQLTPQQIIEVAKKNYQKYQ